MSERKYNAYGRITEIPTEESELTNDTRAGSMSVDGILIETTDKYTFVSVISGNEKISVKAGYIANALKVYASAMEYPFSMKWKKVDGKNKLV